MPAKFSPLPDDEPTITLPEFLRRLKTEQAFVEKMRAHYEAALALPPSPEVEEMQNAARAALNTLKHHQGVLHARAKLNDALRLLGAAAETSDYEEVDAASKCVDEAVDHLLDVCEPDRSKLMTAAMEIQGMLRALQ